MQKRGEELDFVNGGKLEHPFAVSLTAGNEEEKENIFVKYASLNVDKVYTENNLTREDFTDKSNGKFLASLFDEKLSDGKLIPRLKNLVTLILNYDTKDVCLHMVNAKLASMILKKDSVSPPC